MELAIYKEILGLVEDQILEENTSIDKASKALQKADHLLIKSGFKTKDDSAIAILLDAVWHQAEKEYNKLL